VCRRWDAEITPIIGLLYIVVPLAPSMDPECRIGKSMHGHGLVLGKSRRRIISKGTRPRPRHYSSASMPATDEACIPPPLPLQILHAITGWPLCMNRIRHTIFLRPGPSLDASVSVCGLMVCTVRQLEFYTSGYTQRLCKNGPWSWSFISHSVLAWVLCPFFMQVTIWSDSGCLVREKVWILVSTSHFYLIINVKSWTN